MELSPSTLTHVLTPDSRVRSKLRIRDKFFTSVFMVPKDDWLGWGWESISAAWPSPRPRRTRVCDERSPAGTLLRRRSRSDGALKLQFRSAAHRKARAIIQDHHGLEGRQRNRHPVLLVKNGRDGLNIDVNQCALICESLWRPDRHRRRTHREPYLNPNSVGHSHSLGWAHAFVGILTLIDEPQGVNQKQPFLET